MMHVRTAPEVKLAAHGVEAARGSGPRNSAGTPDALPPLERVFVVIAAHVGEVITDAQIQAEAGFTSASTKRARDLRDKLVAQGRVTRIPVTASGRGRIGFVYAVNGAVATGMDNGFSAVATGGSNWDSYAESAGVATGPIYVHACTTPSLDANDAEDHREQADVEEPLAQLERLAGTPIAEPGRTKLLVAFCESAEGVWACWHERASAGDNPIGLLLHMIASGEHLLRALPKPRCGRCGTAESVSDVTLRLLVLGHPCGFEPSDPTKFERFACDNCAREHIESEES